MHVIIPSELCEEIRTLAMTRTQEQHHRRPDEFFGSSAQLAESHCPPPPGLVSDSLVPRLFIIHRSGK